MKAHKATCALVVLGIASTLTSFVIAWGSVLLRGAYPPGPTWANMASVYRDGSAILVGSRKGVTSQSVYIVVSPLSESAYDAYRVGDAYRTLDCTEFPAWSRLCEVLDGIDDTINEYGDHVVIIRDARGWPFPALTSSQLAVFIEDMLLPHVWIIDHGIGIVDPVEDGSSWLGLRAPLPFGVRWLPFLGNIIILGMIGAASWSLISYGCRRLGHQDVER